MLKGDTVNVVGAAFVLDAASDVAAAAAVPPEDEGPVTLLLAPGGAEALLPADTLLLAAGAPVEEALGADGVGWLLPGKVGTGNGSKPE